MEEQQLQIFITSIIGYFKKVSGVTIETGVPFLKDEEKSILLAYTGVIGISGKMMGAIYITAEEGFLFELLNTIMPGTEKNMKNISGMAGELANTIAGNAQKALGKEFLISIPMMLTSESDKPTSTLDLKAPTFVIPLKWKDHQAYLVVGLQK